MSTEYLDYYDPLRQNGSDFNYTDQYAQQAAQAGQANGNGQMTVTPPETPQVREETPSPTAGSTPTPTSTDPKHPDYIRQKIAEWRAKGFGRDDGQPMTDADAQYWLDQVTKDGNGWNSWWDEKIQSRKGQGGGTGTDAPVYEAPKYTPTATPPPTPMVTANGGIPPGVPYTPVAPTVQPLAPTVTPVERPAAVAPTLQTYDTSKPAAGIPYNPVAAGEYYHPNTARPSFSATIPTYTPGQITQFSAPNYSGTEGLQDNVLQQILTTPALSQDYVNRANEAQKETALQREQGARKAAMVQAAGRGVAYGGAADATQRRIGADTTSAIMQGQRDIANSAEIANRQGFLNAIDASNSTLTGRGNRATSFYNTLLGGQQAQTGENFRGYQSQEQAFADALKRDFGLEDMSQAEASSRLGYANLDENRQQFYRDLAMKESQFERDQALNAAKFDTGNAYHASKFNITTGLDARKFDAGQALDAREFDTGNALKSDQFNRTFQQTGNIADLNRAADEAKWRALFAQNENQFGADFNQKNSQFGADLNYRYAANNQTAYQNFINSLLGIK